MVYVNVRNNNCLVWLIYIYDDYFLIIWKNNVKIWVFFVYVLLLVIIIFSIYLRDKNMLKNNC